MLRKFRISSQIIFFVLFCAGFFLINRMPHPYTLPADLFLRLNPLIALLTEIASRNFINTVFYTGIAVALLTILFGRFFCGMICPLGAMIDFVDKFLVGKARSASRTPPQYLHRLKYIFLVALIVLALSGTIFPLFMDPISLLTRIFALMINPMLTLAGMSTINTTGPLLQTLGLDNVRLLTFHTPVFYSMATLTILTVTVFAGSFWDRRFWCQYVCPSGALFGLLGRFPLFRRVVDGPGCTNCARCARSCPTHAIDKQKIEKTAAAECIECGLCTSLKDNCSAFRLVPPAAAAIKPPDLHRRHAFFGLFGGLLLVPTFKTSAVDRADGRGRLIRPPGALPEPDFSARCIACGNCMKACPTNVIQPCSVNDGFNRLFTPKIVPRIGFCDAKCSLCGYACPTGALQKLPVSEKAFAKIGTAVIDRHRCLAWSQNKECQVCDEVCPYNAIEPRMIETTKGPFIVPVVWEDRCMGCGLCENKCPIFDEAAIIVYRFGENRRSDGIYASPSQKERLMIEREKSANETYNSSDGLKEQNASPGETGGAVNQSIQGGGNALPPGFSDD
jgi:MauM/NapG family ferredoxin protein